MQRTRGFIVGCANGWLWSPERQSTPNSKLGELFIDKNHSISILHTGYKVIGYMFAKQSHWYKLHGLLFKLRRPRAFQLSLGLFSSPSVFSALPRAFTGCILIGWLQVTRWVRGIPPFHGNQNPSPGWPQPRQPHIIKLISQLQKPTRKISDK